MSKKKQRPKAIPHCYRRNLSRTLSNSSVSQLIQIGSYKKRINDLSRNNRHLATALQDVRLEAAVQQNMLKDCAKDCNKILFARLKLNEMAKNLAKFVTDLEEVRGYLNVNLMPEKPFTHKKGSPSDKLCKKLAITCIEEVSEESSVNETVVPVNGPTVSNPIPNKSDVCTSNQGNGAGLENMDIAPILFADDLEEKNKKSSSKRKTSKKSCDTDKGSLTPELNDDLTCLKLKRNSSRRQTQVFQFPGSRSTSRGKTTPVGKENSPEHLVTPEKLASPTLAHRKQTLEEIFKSPLHNNLEERETKNSNNFPEDHIEYASDANQCNLSNVSTINLAKQQKNVATVGNQLGGSNHTVLLCEDMELTEVIRPVHGIIFGNGLPFAATSDDANTGCDKTKENSAVNVSGKTKENNSIDIISEKESEKLFSTHPNTPKLLNDDHVQLPEINEHDEVQNVGLLTFCESNNKDKNVESRYAKSSRMSRRAEPVKYAAFFFSDESDEDFPSEVIATKPVKPNTVSSTRPIETSEKIENSVKTVSPIKTNKSSEKTDDPIKTESSSKNHKSLKKTGHSVKIVNAIEIGKSSEKTADPIKTVSSTKTGISSEKTVDPIEVVSSTKTGKSSEKIANSIKTVSSTKTGKSSEKTTDSLKTSSTKPYKSSEKTTDSIKTSSTKPHKSSEKKTDSIKTSSSKTNKSSEKTVDPIKTISSTKIYKSSEKSADSVKSASSTKTDKSEKTEESMKSDSSKSDKSSEKTVDSIKTANSTETDKSEKIEEFMKPASSKSEKSSEKTDDLVHGHKVHLEKEIKNDHMKCSVDVLHTKKVEKKSSKKSKDTKSSSKNHLLQKGENSRLNENVKKLMPCQENVKNPIINHKNVTELVSSPYFSPSSILKKTQPNLQITKKLDIETPLNKIIFDDSSDESLINGIETPKSGSRKVSFAPTDTVCNFRGMSVSKKIAENKKVRRTSKSVFDVDELFKRKKQAKLMGADNSSKTTAVQGSTKPDFNFSDDTELYNSQISSNNNFSSVPTTDDLMSKFSFSSDASQKNISKKDKLSKKIAPASKREKLSLKRSKGKGPLISEPLLTWDEIEKRKNALLCESPVPVSKPKKRKSLFKEHLDDSKENINANYQILEEYKNVSPERDINVNSESSQNNHSKKSSTKTQSKIQKKGSTKKLSDKIKLSEPTPGIKKIRQSMALKCLENSPVLKDTVNLPEAQDEVPLKRRSKTISYREPSLNKKLRRE